MGLKIGLNLHRLTYLIIHKSEKLFSRKAKEKKSILTVNLNQFSTAKKDWNQIFFATEEEESRKMKNLFLDKHISCVNDRVIYIYFLHKKKYLKTHFFWRNIF